MKNELKTGFNDFGFNDFGYSREAAARCISSKTKQNFWTWIKKSVARWTTEILTTDSHIRLSFQSTTDYFAGLKLSEMSVK